MKTLKKYKYNSNHVPLQSIGDDTYLHFSSCILTTNHLLTLGDVYFLFCKPLNDGLRIREVMLKKVYFENGVIILLLKDIKSQLKISLSLRENQCDWILVHPDYFHDAIWNSQKNGTILDFDF